MDIVTDKSGILLKIGIDTWQEEIARWHGLNLEEVEQKMFNYYKAKKERKETMEALVKDGAEVDSFEYYPKLIKEVMEWYPDGAIYKKNLVSMGDMLKSNLERFNFELIIDEMKVDLDRIRISLVKESEVKKLLPVKVEKTDPIIKKEKSEPLAGTYAILPDEVLKDLKGKESDSNDDDDSKDSDDDDDSEDSEDDDRVDSKKGDLEIGWNREEKMGPKTLKDINKSKNISSEFANKDLVVTERTAIKKTLENIPTGLKILKPNQRPKINQYQEQALFKPRLMEKDLKNLLKTKEGQKVLLREMNFYWNSGGLNLPINHTDPEGMLRIIEKYNLDEENFSTMGYRDLIHIMILEAYKDYHLMEPLAVKKSIEKKLKNDKGYVSNWSLNPLSENNLDNWVNIVVKIKEIMMQWENKPMPKEIKDLFVDGFKVESKTNGTKKIPIIYDENLQIKLKNKKHLTWSEMNKFIREECMKTDNSAEELRESGGLDAIKRILGANSKKNDGKKDEVKPEPNKLNEVKSKKPNEGKCLCCGKTGHYAFDIEGKVITCKEYNEKTADEELKKKLNKAMENRKNRYNQMKKIGKVSKVENELSMGDIKAVIESGGIKKEILILADTGAIGLNPIPENVAKKIFGDEYDNLIIPCKGNVRVYSNSNLNILGEIEVLVKGMKTAKTDEKIGNENVHVKFTVVKDGSDVIFGRHDLGKLGLGDKGNVLSDEIITADHVIVHEEEPFEWEEEEPWWKKKCNEAKIYEDEIKQADEFYKEFMKKVWTAKVNAIKKMQGELAMLDDEVFKRLSKSHNTLGKGHLKKERLYKEVNRGCKPEKTIPMKLVELYIKYCPTCQKMAFSKASNAGYYPKLETLNPFVNYADVLEVERGFNVLVVFNPMLRKAAWEIIEKQDALTVAEALILINSRQMRISGVEWRSDKGPSFTSDEVQGLLEGLGADIKFGVAGSHQDQSNIERSFREIRKHLVPILAELSDTYKGNLRSVAIALAFNIYNNIESVVGFAPNEAFSPIFYNENLRDYLNEVNGNEITGSELLKKTVEIQEAILEKIYENQEEIFKKRTKENEEYPVNILDLKQGDTVCLTAELPDKHDYKKTGPWIVERLVQLENTNQWHVELNDPVNQVENFYAHVSKLTKFFHDPRHGTLQEIRGRDLKETKVVEILDHVCFGDPKKMNDYDFYCLWANGIKSYIPYSEASKLELFITYIEPFEEFANVKKGRKSRADKAKQSPPTRPQKRRRKINHMIVNEVLQFIAGQELDAPGENSLTMNMFAQNVTVEEVIETITSKFQPKGEDLERIKKWFSELIKSNPKYYEVFTPITKDHFMKTEKVQLRMDPNVEHRSPPVRPIHNPEAAAAYKEFIKKLLMEGRARKLPPNSEVPINNPPYMVIDYYMEDGKPKWRFTQDAKWRNNVTIKKPYFSRQTIADRIQKMGKKYKGLSDIKIAYFQVLMDEESQKWTRWICPIDGSVYEMLGMDMGGCNSPSELQDRMDKIFGIHTPYVDDLMNSDDTIEEHMEWITKILDLCVEYNIKLAPAKTLFFQFELEVLGRLVDNNTHTMNDETRNKILAAERPRSVKELQRFVGMENWGRDYIFWKGLFSSDYTKPLTEMYNENPTRLNWTPERIQAFEDLKEAVTNRRRLVFFDEKRTIHVAMDASKKGWGAIAFHLNNDGTKDIFAIASGSFNPTEQKWRTNDHEAKAIHNALKAFKTYLLGREFIMFTDNKNLTFFQNNKSDMVQRWANDIAQFTFKSYHIPGKFNWETDFLSRMKLESSPPKQISFRNVSSTNVSTSHGGV